MEAFARPFRFLIFSILLMWALYYAQGVLVPLCFGGLLSMLFAPPCRKMEAKGVRRGLAALACVLLFLLIIGGIIFLLSWQFNDLAKDITGIEQKVKGFIKEFRQYIQQTFGISEQQQQKLMEQQQSSGGGKIAGVVSDAVGSLFSVMVNFVLVVVYCFLLLFYRTHIKAFILKISGASNKEKAESIIKKAGSVAQQYITGLSLMIVCLWVLYGIGFSIVGVKHAIFFAILCGLLEIVPFVGNITGTSLTIISSFAQGGEINIVIGILVTYGIIQFFQTYILEPLVVGAEVNINPLITILVLVIGEALWGIGGMVLAIPLTGIIKIICDHVDVLKPYGFLLGKSVAKSKERKKRNS